MDTTNNERASGGLLRVGLIADGDRFEAVGPVVRTCSRFRLVAQSGMAQSAALPDVPWFDDRRLLVQHPDVQAVVLAVSTRTDAEMSKMAVERGLHVWRLPPLGRTFAEAAELASRAKRQGVIYRVASWWEHVSEHAWREVGWPDGFVPLFSEVRAAAAGPPVNSWRARLQEAGGGALASEACGLLEALVAVRGLPESVTAALGKYRTAAGAAPRETEDTAVAILRYAGGGIATVRALWDLPPTEHQLLHHGQSARVALSDEEVALADVDGRIADRHPVPADFLSSDIHRFAELVSGDARDRAAGTLERHLAVTALLETIYLAGQTNHPESPRKLYEVQGWPVPR